MADNVTSELVIASGSTFRTDEDVGGGGHVPYNKLMYGADGTFTIASVTNPYPVGGGVAHDAAIAGSPVLVAGVASAAAPTAVSADQDVVHSWHLLNGAQATVVTAAGALIGGDAANGLDVDVTRLPALVAGTANIGDVDVLTIAAGDNNIGNVDVLTIAAGDNNIGNVDIVSLPASTNTLEVVGDVAHDAAAAGNPVAIAARATNAIEGLTLVAAADATFVTSDLDGCLVVRPNTTLAEILVERVSNTDGASTAFATFGAGGAGIFNYITTIVVHNAHASTNSYIDLRDGIAGAIIMTIPAPAGGGSVINLAVPLKQTTANTALAYDGSAAVTTIYISLVGFQAKG